MMDPRVKPAGDACGIRLGGPAGGELNAASRVVMWQDQRGRDLC